jgi:hypothetical protein
MMKYRSPQLFLRTALVWILGRSHRSRWKSAADFDTEWSERSELIASLIAKDAVVLDVGSGRGTLQSYLGSGCRYVPLDLYQRTPETIVCDLNEPPYPDLGMLGLDVAVLAGVLEYVSKPERLLAWLAGQAGTCIVSYGCARSRPGTAGRFLERLDRLGNGWANAYSRDELIGLFEKAGFRFDREAPWNTETGTELIFVFHRFDG